MVTRRRLRAFLSTLALYVGCALVIGYFGVNAYTGNHGLRAQQDIDQQFTALTDELGLSQPTVSHHLRLLREAGLVSVEKRGTWGYYRLQQEALDELRDALGVPAAAP